MKHLMLHDGIALYEVTREYQQCTQNKATPKTEMDLHCYYPYLYARDLTLWHYDQEHVKLEMKNEQDKEIKAMGKNKSIQ